MRLLNYRSVSRPVSPFSRTNPTESGQVAQL
jgi:hypothetical protein